MASTVKLPLPLLGVMPYVMCRRRSSLSIAERRTGPSDECEPDPVTMTQWTVQLHVPGLAALLMPEDLASGQEALWR